VCQIGRFEECWVITRNNNRESIEKALNAHPMPRVSFRLLRLAEADAFFGRRARGGVFIYYYLWQAGAYLLAKKLFRKVRFDLVHHVTFGSYWRPSFSRCCPRLFFGDLSEGPNRRPAAFSWIFEFARAFYEVVRSAARYLAEFDPFVRMTAPPCGRRFWR